MREHPQSLVTKDDTLVWPRDRRRRFAATAVLVLLAASPARASFHLAAINEVVTSHSGDASIQFVEITMNEAGQNLVKDTVLAAFDTDGNYIQDLLVVPDDVPNGDWAPWLMGTAGLEAAAFVALDFIIPAALPTGGGMICWGAPGTTAPDPSSWDHSDPENYVDCLAYGSYSGPMNSKSGIPTTLDGDGHSLFRERPGEHNLFDFVCSFDSFPNNNALEGGMLEGTSPCPTTQAYTLPESLPFSGPGDGGTISGTIHPVLPTSSEIVDQAVCIFEDFCDFPFDALFFQVTLDPGSADLFYVVPLFSPVAAGGANTSTGHLDDAIGATRAPMGLIITGRSEGPTFDDLDMGNQLQAGETSDVLFVAVSYGVLSYYASVGPLTVDFQLSRYSLDPGDSFATDAALPIAAPEPGRGLLGGGALAVLAALARRRGRGRPALR